ncbi:MAG: pitrilysin family protein [Patescibacteria group bacterium]
MKNFERIVLKNGIRVILVPQKSSLATTVLVIVEAGSKYEVKQLNGISHFLEHMCFKGTTRRPNASDIATELDSLGAQYNAFTTQEFTSYYAKVRNESFDKALDLVADMYLDPIFDSKEIEKEKGVITEEINMYEDLPQRKVNEVFTELLYGDQPAGWPITGPKEAVARITKDDFLKYRAEHYQAQATTFVIAGGFEEKGIAEKIEKTFAALSQGKKGTKPKVIEAQSAPAEKIRYKKSDQTHMILGFRAFDTFDERRYALEVLADILGGGMSSRLFKKVRDELGAAYYVNAWPDLSSDHGTIAMTAGVNHEKLETVMKAGLEEFARFKNERVEAKELRRAKDHLIGNLFLSLEGSDEIGYYYGSQEAMHKELQSPEELAQKIEAVSTEEIQNVAHDLFQNNGLNFAMIGPSEEKSYRAILKV